MKKLLLLCLLLAPVLGWGQDSIRVGSLDNLNRKSGFRDALFNAPLSSFKNMRLVKIVGNERRYVRTGDKLRIGEFPLESIIYTFYKSRLYQIDIMVATQRNIEGVNLSLIVSYGQPEIVNGNFGWGGSRVRLTSVGEKNFAKALIRFTFLPIEAEIEADNNKAGIKAASDL